MSVTTTAVVLAWVAILLLVFAMAGVIQQVARLSRRDVRPELRAGPEVGVEAPSLNGAPPPEQATILFLESRCPACEIALEDVRALVDEKPELEWIIAYADQVNAESDNIEALRGRATVLQGIPEAFGAYAVPATPFAVAVNHGQIVAAEPVGAHGSLRTFVNFAADSFGHAQTEVPN